MGTSSSNWFNVVRRKFAKKSPQRDIIVVYSNDTTSKSQQETIATEDEENANLLLHATETVSPPKGRILTHEEDIAAMTIQAHFRGHLARRAFRALRSLVKLQAMVRGARVRKQARIALHCMHAMVRLQVTVRSRQILGKASRDDLATST